MLTIGSLFSGIGGLELGLERAGLGPVRWQVEIDPWCRDVLARQWPHAFRYNDVTKLLPNELNDVDLICGGFPCQDISPAGKRAGLAGSRSGLWSEFRRIVAGARPRWVVVENVAGNASAWVDAVCASLGELGYATLPIPISAAACGALHERARVFLVAYSDDKSAPQQRRRKSFKEVASRNAPDSDSDGLRLQPGRRSGASRTEAPIAADIAADANGCWELQPRRGEREERRWSCDGSIWTTEPNVARVVHGLPRRLARERRRREAALGNAVVPQCAEVVGYVIRELRKEGAGS